ncbi:MAG: MlaD family protein [Treponema sp.]|jgi:phospholipid/cholesterol/gamma-HCH transport system substrate-binding protein|nr:MlaD family protein [Treponema sp.]
MKFTIRFVDQIVGVFIILALGVLIFVIFMLGSSQRWFSRDYQFKSYFTSAAGLSDNMAVQYKGFTIGHVKSFVLANDDRVEVVFTVFDTYVSRVTDGSLVEVLVSPIGLGNQFIFYPGLGTERVAEGAIIPAVNSREGKQLLAKGLASVPGRDDGINIIMTRAGTMMETVNNVLLEIEEAITGSERTVLGRTLGDVEAAAGGLQNTVGDIGDLIRSVIAQINPILANVNNLTGKINDPNSTITKILDSDSDVYANLVTSLESISGTLKNLEKTTDFIPAQLPQVAALISELRTTLGTVEDVLVALTNNPLLKNGVPGHIETKAGGVSPRDISF